MAKDERKSPIGLQRLVVWNVVEDTEESLKYGTPVPVSKALMSAKDTPTTQTASQDADDQTVDEVTIVMGGQLNIGLTATNSSDRELFYGNKIDGGTNVVNKDDISPYNGVAFMTARRDGLFNLHKYPKASFSPQEESYGTKTKNGINYAVTNLQGNYIPTIKNGNAHYIRYGVDPVVDKEIITQWFTNGEYYKPETEA